MNQTNVVLSHLKSGRTITTMDAYELYGITRLSAKIFELRDKGYNIQFNRIKTTNRFGNKCSYKEYFLVNEGDGE